MNKMMRVVAAGAFAATMLAAPVASSFAADPERVPAQPPAIYYDGGIVPEENVPVQPPKMAFEGGIIPDKAPGVPGIDINTSDADEVDAVAPASDEVKAEDKADEVKAESKKAEPKKAKALPRTGVAGGVSGLGAVAAFAGAAAVAIRRYMK